MQSTLDEQYQERVEKFHLQLKALERQILNISVLRLVVFVLSVILVYYFARQGSSPGIMLSLGGGIFFFLLLIRMHAGKIEQKELQKAMWIVNKDELTALRGESGQFYDGEEFCKPGHPYCNDLDLFGRGSIFQFLNRTSTVSGRRKLATALNQPILENDLIKGKQEAVDELTKQLEWRQKFQAIGIAYHEGPDDQMKIENWSLSKPLFKALIFKVLIVAIPLFTLAMLYLLVTGGINFQVFLVYLLIPWGLSGSYAMKVNQRHNSVSKTAEMLRKYALLLKEIEGLTVKAGYLSDLKQRIYNNNNSAGKSIRALSAILTALDNRLNFVSWALLNGLLLWDILQMVRLESWQKKNRADMKNWFDVVAEFDVINCFANFRYNHENTVFPEVSEGAFEVVAREAGHPLIDKESRVNNEIRILDGEFLIITGANMAGKSTYLRTIGVNLVLAMCGAPVCAAQFRFAPVQLYTSIRTSDSLNENESYFYAELKRLKAIIDELRDGRKLFIILDEILKGTNSKDKHAGSEALLQQLVTFKTSGVVATHDVLLGKLSEKFPENIRNHCFEVDIAGDQLHFDYRLREGVSKNLNATILMREMGITI